MPRSVQYVFGTLIAALLVAGPALYFHWCRTRVRNFQSVREGVLYRSGQLTIPGLRQVVHDHGIRTLITLRDQTHPGRPMPDLDEEDFCRSEDLTFVRIPPRAWWAPDGSVPADKGVSQFRDVMDDPANYPVLIHCFGGVHRTGAFRAIYRMEYEHWSNDKALEELRLEGYTNFDDHMDILTYLEGYRPRWQPGVEPPLAAELKVEKAAKKKTPKALPPPEGAE